VANELTWVYGIHAVMGVLERHPERIQRLCLLAERTDERVQKIMARAQAANVVTQAVNKADLGQWLGDVNHQGVAAQCTLAPQLAEGDIADLVAAAQNPLILVLDGVQDPHNLGACLRTADAAGATMVMIPKDRASSVTPVVRKVSCGASETVPVVQVTNLARGLRTLKDLNVWLYGADMDAPTTVYQQDYTGPVALILGSEGNGLRHLTRETCDYLIKIPMQGTVSSLNVSVSAGICLYEAVRQRGSS
jgi:23S rRNA (guanosine2251-2'-O)-methyltransferase